MANKGIVIPLSVAGQNIDSLNHSFVSVDNIENGSIFTMGAVKSGNSDLYEAVKPATANLGEQTFMAMSPIRIVTTLPDGTQFVDLSLNPQAFENVAGQIIDGVALQVGDKVRLSVDAIAGTKSSNKFITATNGAYKLTWAAEAGAGLTLKLVEDSYISVATGDIGSQRVASYDFIVTKA